MDSSGDTMGVQSLQDIENYLANFNKEISDQSYILTNADNATNTLYTTDSGAIYQQTTTDAIDRLKLERSGDVSGASGDHAGFELAGACNTDGLLATLHGAPAGATPVGINNTDDDHAELIQGAGDQPTAVAATTAGTTNYQTVTIVPSEVSQSGEVSYVLIVSQQDKDNVDDDDEANADLSIYDFKEEAKAALNDSPYNTDEETPVRKSTRRSASYGELANSSVVSGPMGSMHLMCNYCNYTSPKRYLLARHMKAHSEERPHKCSICSRTFKTIPALQNHINTHTGVRPQHCKECDASFTTSGELIRHVRYRHTYEKPHRCTECDYASVELSKLRRHIRSHTGERPYCCPHCAYASPDTYKLKRHLRTHTGEKPYLCDICQLRFTQSNSLKAHKLIHSGMKPVFQCELCPTTCGRKTDLKYHVMKLHTSDRPLQCRKCGKAFPDRYTYKIHLKTHDGEKCFRCELCPYSALDQRHLESHILTHTGQKPYNCQFCDHSFRQKQLLRRHINLYHVPGYIPPAPRDKIHTCDSCHKSFAHRGNLLRHLTLHDPDNMEYEEAVRQGEASTGEEEEEDGEEEGESFLELHNAVTGAELTEIDGEQMQVQLVRVEGQEGEQVYIQIGDQMEMLTQQQARQVQEQAGLLLSVDNDATTSSTAGAAVVDVDGLVSDDAAAAEADGEEDEDDMSQYVKREKSIPAKKPRGRPRKQKQVDSDDDYEPVSRSPRGRGRGRGRSTPGRKSTGEQQIAEERSPRKKIKLEDKYDKTLDDEQEEEQEQDE